MLAIFRAKPEPDDDGQMYFVQLRFDDEGIEASGKIFHPGNKDSSYYEMDFDHIVLSQEIPNFGSRDVVRYQLGKGGEDSEQIKVWALSGEDLNHAILTIWNNWKEEHGDFGMEPEGTGFTQ